MNFGLWILNEAKLKTHFTQLTAKKKRHSCAGRNLELKQRIGIKNLAD